MMSPGWVFALLCVVMCAEGHRHHPQTPRLRPHHLDKRCERNSVTKISCADMDVKHGLAAHPDDCRLFYYCVHPFHPPICRQCPAKLHFNPSLLVCDHPHRAGCKVPHKPSTEPSTADDNGSSLDITTQADTTNITDGPSARDPMVDEASTVESTSRVSEVSVEDLTEDATEVD